MGRRPVVPALVGQGQQLALLAPEAQLISNAHCKFLPLCRTRQKPREQTYPDSYPPGRKSGGYVATVRAFAQVNARTPTRERFLAGTTLSTALSSSPTSERACARGASWRSSSPPAALRPSDGWAREPQVQLREPWVVVHFAQDGGDELLVASACVRLFDQWRASSRGGPLDFDVRVCDAPNHLARRLSGPASATAASRARMATRTRLGSCSRYSRSTRSRRLRTAHPAALRAYLIDC